MQNTEEFSLENNQCNDDEKIWEIFVTGTPDPNIVIKCDDAVLLDTTASLKCISWSSLGNYWTSEVKKIQFLVSEAPALWRAKKGSRPM